MSLLVSTVVDNARLALFDPAPGAGWSDDELIAYLNSAVRMVIGMKPDAAPVAEDVTLVDGTKQSLPAAGLLLLDAYYNGDGGSVALQSVHEFVRTHTGWAAEAAGATSYVFFDPRLPKVFHVSPPATAGMTLAVLYGAVPAPVDSRTDDVGLSEAFEPMLTAAVTGFALSKPSARQNLPHARALMESFGVQLGLLTKAQVAHGGQIDIKGVA